ncbi:MAG TPA: hypothetical protein VGN84_04380 [Solirubrobacterales bacterium]|nr:hypothetical protein [Solirubrobacterales bacterium]
MTDQVVSKPVNGMRSTLRLLCTTPGAAVALAEEASRSGCASAESGDGQRCGKGEDETLSLHLFS